jgi:hypothetical protein
LNADYVVGLPVTMRRGWFSTRFRVYHQSSHLGDEYLLREPSNRRNRENLSFEAVEWILSVDARALRLYGGGEYLFRRSPSGLESYVAHGGVELRPDARVIPLGSLGGFRFVAATDLKASQEQDWKPSVSARAGLEYDRAAGGDSAGRRWGFFVEYYTGPSPYGQFFREDIRLIGVGLHFGGFWKRRMASNSATARTAQQPEHRKRLEHRRGLNTATARTPRRLEHRGSQERRGS